MLPLTAACGTARPPAAPAITPVIPIEIASVERPEPITESPIVDPVLSLIAESDHYFRQGQAELEAGHVEGARLAFDRALNVLLESPTGGRTEPRLREHFDRLVERISTYEIRALADGDGFTEQQYEPASIDDLLALSATLMTPDAVEDDVIDAGLEFPVPLNARVLSFVKLFEGRLREFLADGLQRGSQYLPMIRRVFREQGLPLDLAYVPLVESAFKPQALSRARAKGIWQFMRGTGLENGLRQDWYVDERSDPEKATLAAAKYLSTLVTMFDGDWLLALASYNGGPGRVQSAIRRTGQSDFWRISARPNILPRETRDYVPMILAAILIARSPAEYGFAIDPLPPARADLVTLTRPVDLRRIAEWTDTTVTDIQALNPELRRWTTPVRDEAYGLKVPAGTAAVVTARLVESQDEELASLRWHTVKRGETLATIARSLRTSRTDLAEANYLPSNARLTVGQRLIVPHEPTVLLAAATDRPGPSGAVPSSGDVVRVVYEVRRGDTLAAIARSFRTTVAAIQDWNSLNGTRIYVGDELTIFTPLRGN
jgi:membrane-bound lytic murein transglycosylase D